ncbi:hypothetical protein SLE2022_008760 [Rubroshorea leprosula]
MSALTSSFVSFKNPQTKFVYGSSLRPVDQCLFNTNAKPTSNRRSFTVRAGDGGRRGGAGLFIGGFILGGLTVGTLGCVYAPQISKALAGVDRKDLMRKLPKFIYDEEKALEKNRRMLEEKIEQLNSAIDDVSAQLHASDSKS